MEELELWARKADECCGYSLMRHSSGSSEGKSAERNTDRGSLVHKVWGKHKNFIRNMDRGYVIF